MQRTSATVYVGLGSNIEPEKNLRTAVAMLRKKFPDIRCSSIYKTAPWGHADQVDFLNAAAVFETEETPEDTQNMLQVIEKKLKKSIPFKNGPRTIDLDILLFGQEIRLEDTLTIPHFDLHLRRFVLEPLIELGAGDLLHPGFDLPLKRYLPKVEDQTCERIQLKAL